MLLADNYVIWKFIVHSPYRERERERIEPTIKLREKCKKEVEKRKWGRRKLRAKDFSLQFCLSI